MPAGSHSADAAPGFTGVYVFGDSLVDPGNDLLVAQDISSLPFGSLPNGAPTADKGYFDGRFTDGYNYADLVSNKLLGEPTQATFPYGVTNDFFGFSLPVGQPSGHNLSFAYGGATVLPGSYPIPDLATQTSVYSNFHADPNALYLVSIGANDLLGLVPTGGTPVTGAQADATLGNVAAEIARQVEGLYAQGARHIVVANIPDLGVTPAYAGADQEATRRALLTQDAQTVNSELKADLNALALPAGATLSQYDLFAYTDAVTANPAAYGFSDVTQALISAQPAAPDPTGGGFLFFDKLHPTAQAHAQIAAELLQTIANPGAPFAWTAAAAIGAQVHASLAPGAFDSFTASLVGGRSYVIDLLGVSSGSGTLADPKVQVLDGSGAAVAHGDDGGLGLDTHLQFTAPATGDYTIQASGVGASSGSFHLQVGDAGGANLLLGGALRGSNETVTGGDASDTLVASAGANYLRGGAGDDSIVGGSGFDDINGNLGADSIDGGSGGDDWLVGGQGNDLITAHAGHNILYGNLGDDTLYAGSGGDILRGGQGDDVIVGGAGADWISGDRGENTVTGGAGADTFHSFAGAGVDHVTDFHAAEGDRVLLDPGSSYTASQVGADVVVDLGSGTQVILQNVQLGSLPSGWIVTG